MTRKALPPFEARTRELEGIDETGENRINGEEIAIVLLCFLRLLCFLPL
jgi:hypothetical protein